MKNNETNASVTMTIEDLKDRIKDLPDDMEIVVPVINVDDSDKIEGFRLVKTAGILESDGEPAKVFCLNTATNDMELDKQVKKTNRSDIRCTRVLF